MANITTTTAAAHISEMWVQDVIRAQEFNLVIAARCNRAWKYMQGGDVYHIPRIGNLSAASKAAGSNWTPQAVIDSEQTLTINVHEVAGFQIDDIVTVLNKTDVKAEYQKKIGYALGRAVDANIAALPQNFSQIVGTLGVELTYDNCLRAWQYLADAGEDGLSGLSWVLSPAAIAGLLKQDIVINQLYRQGNRAVETAKVGQILGADVLQSNLTRAPAANQSESFIMQKEAIALMMAQEVKMVTEYRADSLSWIVGGHQIYGYIEVDRYTETASLTPSTTDDWAVLLRTIS